MKIIQQDEGGNYTIESSGDGSGLMSLQSDRLNLNNQNSKVQIISNLTLVSKSQSSQQQLHSQPQQISYVTTNKSLGNNAYVNAMLAGKTGATTLAGGKLINVPTLKNPTKQQQTASIITTNSMQMQKLKMPYRIQSPSNIIIQRSPQSANTAAGSQQHQQFVQNKSSATVQQPTMKTTSYYIQQPQQTHQTQPATANNNNSISYNKNKAVTATSTVKYLNDQPKPPVRSASATTKQLQIQQLQTKNSYKQTAATNSGANSNAPSNKIKYIAGSAPVKSMGGAQQSQVVYQTSKTVQAVGTKKATKIQQQQQQQQQNQQIYQHQSTVNSYQRPNNIVYNQGSVQKVVTKGNNKFLVQNSVGGGGGGYTLPTGKHIFM
jgi:hypothetical protein